MLAIGRFQTSPDYSKKMSLAVFIFDIRIPPLAVPELCPFVGVVQLSASSAKIIGVRGIASNGAQMMVWKRMLGRNELTAVEARQGYLDRPVLVVLIVSLMLALLALGAVLI